MKPFNRMGWMATAGWLFLTLSCSTPVGATIYKWTDETGKTHYTNDKSKIPLRYRKSGKIKKLLGTGDGGGAGGQTGASSADSKKDAGELTDEEKALIKEVIAYLDQEIKFASDHAQDMATSTSMRQFVNAYRQLTARRKAMLAKLQNVRQPALKTVRAYLEKAVQTAENNPIGMRRMSVANGIQRVQGETAGHGALKKALQGALDLDEKLKKEKQKEKEKEKGRAAGKKPAAGSAANPGSSAPATDNSVQPSAPSGSSSKTAPSRSY